MTQYVIKAERENLLDKWVLIIYEDILDEVFEREVEDKKNKK